MTTYIALLRAVNVGGTGKLPMQDLRALCEAIGFTDVRTYIASGNVVFTSSASADDVKRDIEAALAGHVGKPVGVLVRSAEEMVAVLAANPFSDGAANTTVAIFLDRPPLETALDNMRGRDGERVALGAREIYVDYGEGMGRTKLVIPSAKSGTARNMNTVAKLVGMARSQPAASDYAPA